MICGLYSPLAKVFQRDGFKITSKEGKISFVSLEDLIENPLRITDSSESNFSIYVPRSQGSIEFAHAKPKQIVDPLLLEYLTATRTNGISECDMYGIVPFHIKQDALAEAITSAEDEEEAIRSRLKADRIESLEMAKKASHEKLMRAVRNVVQTIKESHQKLSEESKGKTYMPSETEILCTFILADEMAKTAQKRDSLMKKFQFAMDGAFEKL